MYRGPSPNGGIKEDLANSVGFILLERRPCAYLAIKAVNH